jgi:hypothetical protein
MQVQDIERYVETAAARLELSIPQDSLTRVIAFVRVAQGMAELVVETSALEDCESAAVFRVREAP